MLMVEAMTMNDARLRMNEMYVRLQEIHAGAKLEEMDLVNLFLCFALLATHGKIPPGESPRTEECAVRLHRVLTREGLLAHYPPTDTGYLAGRVIHILEPLLPTFSAVA